MTTEERLKRIEAHLFGEAAQPQKQQKPRFEPFIVDCTKDEYPEVKCILEATGYSQLGAEWLQSENCVRATEHGKFITWKRTATSSLSVPIYTVAQLRELYYGVQQGQEPTEELRDWVVPLAHPTLSREEVVARCIAAAEKKGYKAHDRYYMEFREDTTHFACYSDGVFCLRNHECYIKNHTTLEEFEAYCGVEQPKQEGYNAGFRVMGKGYLALRLADGSELWYSDKDGTWRKDRFCPPINPHTLTPVKRFTVGKFYAILGKQDEHLNDWRSYALCVKNEDVPMFVRGASEYGVVSIDRIRPSHVSNLEVTSL